MQRVVFILSPLPSASLEFWFALLVERADAFPAIFGPDQAVVGVDLHLQARGEVPLQAVAYRAPRLRHRERRVGGDARRRLQRLADKARGFAHAVDDAPGECLLRREGSC